MGGLASIQTLCLLPALGFGTYRRCAIRRGLQNAQARKCKACHAIMFRNLNVMPQDECAFFGWDVIPQYYSSLHYSQQVARGADLVSEIPCRTYLLFPARDAGDYD